MLQNLNYTIAGINDASILAEYRIRFILELNGPQSTEVVKDLHLRLVDYYNGAMADDTCISIIAKDGEVVAGIGSMHIRSIPGNLKNPSGVWGYIMNMYTEPEYRRRGIGKSILNRLLDLGGQRGVKAFELHATPEGEPVYQQCGFIEHNQPTYRKFLT